MLTILDKYIIKKFLKTFFFIFGVIMLLSIVFDLAEKLSEFSSNDATIKEIIFDYYVSFILFHGNMFSSMIIFISVIWFTAKMAQDTEIIPIWNSGRPFTRFIRPYMIAATLLMLISLGLNHFVIPNTNQLRLDFEEKYYRDEMYILDYHAEFPGGQVVYFDSYLADDNQAQEFVIEQEGPDGKLKYFLKAHKAENKLGTNKWVLKNYWSRTIGDTNDIIKEGQRLDTTFQFTIDEMATRENIAETMPYFKLKEFIDREKKKGSSMVATYEVELYQRTSYPFATYVLTIIGIAVASRKKRGGIGINIAIGLGIIFVYIFAMKVTTVAAMNLGFATYVAVWIPNFLFAILAYFLYKKAQR